MDGQSPSPPPSSSDLISPLQNKGLSQLSPLLAYLCLQSALILGHPSRLYSSHLISPSTSFPDTVKKKKKIQACDRDISIAATSVLMPNLEVATVIQANQSVTKMVHNSLYPSSCRGGGKKKKAHTHTATASCASSPQAQKLVDRPD